MTDMVIIGQTRAVGAAETLVWRDDIKGVNASIGEAKDSMKLFGQSALKPICYVIADH